MSELKPNGNGHRFEQVGGQCFVDGVSIEELVDGLYAESNTETNRWFHLIHGVVTGARESAQTEGARRSGQELYDAIQADLADEARARQGHDPSQAVANIAVTHSLNGAVPEAAIQTFQEG